MLTNRRNYYRILQVQPDAPIEVIKASYRTLMQTLKMHPDLGGDHWNAALINEAYELLSDEIKRQEYDKALLKKYVIEDEKKTPHHFCQFCKTPHEQISASKTKKVNYYCLECQSPLEKFEVVAEDPKRKMPRYPKKETMIFYVYWPEPCFIGIIEDLSPNGMRFYMKDYYPLRQNQIIKISGKMIQATARVCHIQTDGSIGVRFLTISFEEKSGNFFNQMI